MARLLALLLALSLPLAACGPTETDAPDATGELADPDPADGPLDVDPLSRDDGQTSDDDFDTPEDGDDVFPTPVETDDPPIEDADVL